ncbi:hypothetical protein R1sor_020049 [Riccia sorocarpa]|uniref:Integrase zinc-binding domain-containing protein n=1 Tax=Riccia sorocarpa TaxID=122646 RepID=A0ABD3IIP1_9MARC
MLLLQEFTFTVEYKPGKAHLNADFLSRIPGEPSATAIDTEPADFFLFTITSQAPWKEQLRHYLETGQTPLDLTPAKVKSFHINALPFTLIQGVLYRMGPDNVLRRCLSAEEIPTVLKASHTDEAGGHFSGELTARKIYLSGYWWPTVHKDYANYVRRCDACQRQGKPLSRTTFKVTTGQIPFQLVYGQEAIMPVEFLIPTLRVLTGYEAPRASQLSQEGGAIPERIHALHNLSEKRIEALYNQYLVQAGRKRRFDNRVKEREFRRGDLVLKLNDKLSRFPSKFTIKWLGPFWVQEVYDNETVQLSTLQDEWFLSRTNVQKIRLFNPHFVPEGVPFTKIPRDRANGLYFIDTVKEAAPALSNGDQGTSKYHPGQAASGSSKKRDYRGKTDTSPDRNSTGPVHTKRSRGNLPRHTARQIPVAASSEFDGELVSRQSHEPRLNCLPKSRHASSTALQGNKELPTDVPRAAIPHLEQTNDPIPTNSTYILPSHSSRPPLALPLEQPLCLQQGLEFCQFGFQHSSVYAPQPGSDIESREEVCFTITMSKRELSKRKQQAQKAIPGVFIPRISLYNLWRLPPSIKLNLQVARLWSFISRPYQTLEHADRYEDWLKEITWNQECITIPHPGGQNFEFDVTIERLREIFKLPPAGHLEAERPFVWDDKYIPAFLGRPSNKGLNSNGFLLKYLAWSPLFVCAKNFVALTGQASNSSYVTQDIVTALFRAVLFGEPSDFAPYIGKKLISALRKYQDPKSVNARNNNKLAFDMMPILLAIVHEVWPGAIVAEDVHLLKVPDSDTLAIFKADSSILGEYEEIGPHVLGEYLDRFTQWSDFEKGRLSAASQAGLVFELVILPEPTDDNMEDPPAVTIATAPVNAIPVATLVSAPAETFPTGPSGGDETSPDVPRRPAKQRKTTRKMSEFTSIARGSGKKIIHHHRRDPRVDGKGRHIVPMDNNCAPIVQEEQDEDEQRPFGQTIPGEGEVTPVPGEVTPTAGESTPVDEGSAPPSGEFIPDGQGVMIVEEGEVMEYVEGGPQPGQLQASMRATNSSQVTVTATAGELGKTLVTAMTQMLAKTSHRVITGTDGLEAIRYAREAFDQVFTAVEPAMGRLQALEIDCNAQEEEIKSLQATVSARDITIRSLGKELEEARRLEAQAQTLLHKAQQDLTAKDQASNALQKG